MLKISVRAPRARREPGQTLRYACESIETVELYSLGRFNKRCPNKDCQATYFEVEYLKKRGNQMYIFI